MCVEYELRADVVRPDPLYGQQTLPFIWAGPAPNVDALRPRIRITEPGIVVRLRDHRLVGEMMTWGWAAKRQTVFSLKSENQDFSQEMRVLILATGYYEYTEPLEPRIAGREQHFFTMKGEPWFAIAGIARNGCFAMLTVKAGPDIKSFCKRQVCLMRPSDSLDWLTLNRPQAELLKPGPRGTIAVRTIYQNEAFVSETVLRANAR